METKIESRDKFGPGKSSREDTAYGQYFLKQIFDGSWITQAVSVAAELGIADILNDGPRSIENLAEVTNTNANALYRVMRALASVNVFTQEPDGRFNLTPTAKLLISNTDISQRFFAIMMGAEFHGAWGELLHTVRTGEPGFQKRFGAPAFRYMMDNPERHRIYDMAMGVYGFAESQSIMNAYDFSIFRTIADIGGGSGMLMSAILKRHEEIKGILFDLPPVAASARARILDDGFSTRCRVEGGDFFSTIPEGADLYIMQHVIHDWDDSNAVTILKNCRKAMNSKSKILLAETVIPKTNEPCYGKWLDLMMLLIGGRERTEDEYRQLFFEAEINIDRIIPTTGEISIIEGSVAR